MTKRIQTALAGAVAIASLAVAPTARADAVSDFYSGKTVTVYVGLAAGGLYSTYAQMMAPHFAEHIPGKPTVIVKHQPGAGGLTALNFVYNAAPKDGTVLITPNSGLSKRVVLGEPNAKFDPKQLQWLGGWGEAVNDCTVWKTSKATTIEEAKKTQLVIGALGKSSNTYTTPLALNNVLGTKFKIISGYGGGADVRLAMEKGEVDGWCGQFLGWKTVKPEWLREGKLAHLVQLASKRTADMPNTPLMSELATNPEQKQIFTFIQSGVDDRALAAPPGVPADRVAALSKAYLDMLKDPKFLEDAKKLKLDIDVVTPEEIRAFVDVITSMKPETIAKLNDAMTKE